MNKITKWKLLEQEKILETPFLTIFQDKLQRDDGKIIPNFYSVRRRDAAFIIALTDEQKVVLVYQYKNGVKDLIWELPAGFIEDNETNIEAAKRELLEETGFTADSYELISEHVPNPSISNNRNYTVLAKIAKKVAEQRLDANEQIQVELVPLEQLVADIKSQTSRFIDSQSQLSLLVLAEKLKI